MSYCMKCFTKSSKFQEPEKREEKIEQKVGVPWILTNFLPLLYTFQVPCYAMPLLEAPPEGCTYAEHIDIESGCIVFGDLLCLQNDNAKKAYK